jgi:5-formyltetrahydrofolate cyclo-ligase
MEKQAVRKEVFRIRREWSDEQVIKVSRNVFANVETYLQSIAALTNETELYLYASYHHETDTGEFLQSCLKKGIKTALPRVAKDGEHMEFFYVNSRKDLRLGYKGIPEPAVHCEPVSEEKDVSQKVILVPGVGFDRAGHRTGYGKGFYDRYLSSHSFCRKIGIAFSFQIFDEIESDRLDVGMDAVITEYGVLDAFVK